MAGYGIEAVLSYEPLAILLYTFVVQSFSLGGIWPPKQAPFSVPLEVSGIAVAGQGTILWSGGRCR